MDKTQEKRNQKRIRWSAVDAILLLLILAALGGMVYRVLVAVLEEPVKSEEMYVVRFDVLPTYEESLLSIKGNDPVYLYENNSHLGYMALRQTESGEEQQVYLIRTSIGQDMATAEGCMICVGGQFADGSLLVDGSDYHLTPGAEVTVCTEKTLFTVRITQIEKHVRAVNAEKNAG